MSVAYEIGPFQLDPEAGVLSRDGTPTALGARAVAVLKTLVEHANEFVPKGRILDAAWPNVVVEEANLAVQIGAIRRVFSKAGGERRTLPEALTSFVGRERELAEIKALLPGKRLLTLVGAGGVGKTRLALQFAAAVIDVYPDVVLLVTSREGLGITGELTYRVLSLSLPDRKQAPTPQSLSLYESVQLFIDRALLMRSDFQVTTQNAPALASLCYHL